jgi:hypothetical protein
MSSICEECSYKCLTCIDYLDDCILCADTNRDLADYCNCKEGYFELGNNSSMCGKCSHKCSSCNN